MEPTILFRLIFAVLQSKGRISKSWFLLLLAAWLDRHDISFAGFDLDDSHRTFSSRYPESKNLTVVDELTGRDEILKIFRAALSGTTPVVLSDTRAQLSSLVLDTITRTQFFSLAQQKGLKLTVPVFVADDDDALRSLIEGMQTTGANVDYLAIKTPALYRSSRYEGSPLQKTLLSVGAQEITMPALMESTRRAMVRAEAACGKALSFPEAAEHLRDFSRADLEFFMAGAFREFDRVARLLLPTAEAQKIIASLPVDTQSKTSFSALSVNLEE
jgi:hypothetical protein